MDKSIAPDFKQYTVPMIAPPFMIERLNAGGLHSAGDAPLALVTPC